LAVPAVLVPGRRGAVLRRLAAAPAGPAAVDEAIAAPYAEPGDHRLRRRLRPLPDRLGAHHRELPAHRVLRRPHPRLGTGRGGVPGPDAPGVEASPGVRGR